MRVRELTWERVPMGERGNALEYPGIHGGTEEQFDIIWQLIGIRGYTKLYATIHVGLQGYTFQCIGIRGYKLKTGISGYTWAYASLRAGHVGKRESANALESIIN